jgi:hypothetical protein
MNKLIALLTMYACPTTSRKGVGIVRSAVSLLLRLSVVIAVVVPAAAARRDSGRQPQCPDAGNKIELTIVASPAPEGTPNTTGLVWKIDKIPGPDQITVCPRLKQKIVDALKDTSPGAGKFQITGGAAHGEEFDAYLMTAVDGLTVTKLFDTDTPPPQSDAGKRVNIVLCLGLDDLNPEDKKACEKPPATAAVTAEIQIATGNIDRLLKPPAPGVHVFDETVSSVPVKLFYSDEDLATARRLPTPTDDAGAQQRLRKELERVAEVVFAEAVKSGGLRPDGAPAFEDPNDPKVTPSFNDFARAINGRYQLVGDIYAVNWTAGVTPNLKIFDFRPGEPGGRWVWSVDGLRLAEQVNIEVVEESWETKEEQGEAIAAKLRKRRQTAYDELNASTRPTLSFQPGHIPTRDTIGSVKGKDQGTGDLHLIEQRVEAVDKVKSGPVVTPSSPAAPGAPEGHNVIFAVRRKKKPELTLGFKAGGGYSKEEGGTGRIGVDEVNLLRLKETVSLDAQAGNEVQKYRFSFTRPIQNSDEAGFKVKDFSIDAQVYKDKDKRLGNLTKEEIAAREVGSSATLALGYNSASGNERANENCITDDGRKRTRFSVNADVGLNYRDVNIRDDDKLLTITGVSRDLLPRERTQATTLSASVSSLLRRDFRKQNSRGPGVLVLRLSEDAQKGFKLFGADYDFWKSSTVAGFDFTFGPSSFRDMFVSYSHGHERSSGGTPVFELPALGGASSVRGVEEGEFIGRRVSFDQFDLGLNVNSLYNLFAHKGRLADSPFCPFAENAEPPKMFDFKNLYVKGFFDHGRLSGSPVAAASGGALRRADGYGVAFELRDLMADASGRRVNLSIGYARSPHSRLHRSGMMFTGVTFDF